MTKLSQQQLEELKEAFIIFDKDNDKKINMKELATVMRSIGFSPTQADLQNIAQESGATHGNKLFDFNETQSIISRRAPPQRKKTQSEIVLEYLIKMVMAMLVLLN